jgi:hypothetical protein
MTLTGAEVLKLVRRRALMTWAVVLTLGSVVVPYAVLVALRALDADRYGPAGGAQNLEHVLGLLALLGGVAAIVVATTAGSQDVASGVFRELVVTGRSRRALFLARVRGALAVCVSLVAAAFGLAVAASYALAGAETTASAGEVAGYGAWLGATTVLNVVLGVALASIVSSRVAVGALLAWNAIVAPLLLQIADLEGLRAAIGTAAAQHFAPGGPATTQVAMSTATALGVLALWIAVPLLAGAHVTKRRDA